MRSLREVYSQIYENTTSSTKPEVRDVLHCRQTRTEPRPQLTCAENFVTLGHVIFEIFERTYRRAYTGTQTQSQYFTHPCRRRCKY